MSKEEWRIKLMQTVDGLVNQGELDQAIFEEITEEFKGIKERLDMLEKNLNKEILWLNSFKLELERIMMQKIDKLDQKIINHLEVYHPLKEGGI